MMKLPYDEVPTKIVDNPSKQEFTELVRSANEPFKVTGSIDHWPLYKILSNLKNPIDQCDYLATLALNQKVHFTIVPPEQKGHLGFNKNLEQNFSFRSKKALFPKFISEVKNYIIEQNLGNLYLQSIPIESLNKKLGSLALFEGFSPMTQPRFWIGSGNQFVTLHNDPYRNIIVIFTGRKRVITFPPEEIPNLYPAPFDKRVAGVITSLVDVNNPDLDKFPLFKQALKKVKVTILNPGEFIYMPPLWWHAVEGESFNVGLNCWFFDDNEINKLHNLYLPAESLMLNINHDLITTSKKHKLYEKFTQIIDTDSTTAKLTDNVDFMVAKEARKNGHIINNSSLSTNQKDLWRRWVKVFAFHYIFCLQGNPFPTLDSNEFSAMVQRYRRTRIYRRIFNVCNTLIIYIYRLFMKKKKKHGVVPL